MANIPLKTITFPELDDAYTLTQVDDTLKTAGKAADAKKTGDEISAIKADLDAIEPMVITVTDGAQYGICDKTYLEIFQAVNSGRTVVAIGKDGIPFPYVGVLLKNNTPCLAFGISATYNQTATLTGYLIGDMSGTTIAIYQAQTSPFYSVSEIDSKLTLVNTNINQMNADLGELQEGGYIADAQQIQSKVNTYLANHPEATTTVLDGSLTESKFSNALKLKTIKDYVTPEMYGASGDGVTDDTVAFQNAVDSGIPVILNGDSHYKVSGIVLGVGCYLNGNGAVITGIGTGDLITIRTYETSQIHTTDPVYVCNLFVENASRLLVIDKGLKITVENVVLKNFSDIGCDFISGYECVLRNFRYEGDPTNVSAVGLRVGSGGGADSIFQNFIGRDVATAVEICSGNNIFENFHFWILTQALFDYSVFFKENAGNDNLNKYVRPYFDSYKYLLQQNKWSASLIDSPTILDNSKVVTGESTLLDIVNPSFTDSYISTRIRIVNAKFKTSGDSLCNVCTNKTAAINMTYFPTSGQQWNKINECNVKSYDQRIESIAASKVISIASGFTVKSSNIYIDEYNSRVFGSMVIHADSALPAGNQTVTIGNPVLKPQNAINRFCILSSSEWNSQEVGYLYCASNAFSIKANSADKTFIKFDFDYIYS